MSVTNLKDALQASLHTAEGTDSPLASVDVTSVVAETAAPPAAGQVTAKPKKIPAGTADLETADLKPASPKSASSKLTSSEPGSFKPTSSEPGSSEPAFKKSGKAALAEAPGLQLAAAPVPEGSPDAHAKPVKESSKEKEKAGKAKRAKVVRDSFTMPQEDYRLLNDLKKQSLNLGVSVKKSELLRAGLQALVRMAPAERLALLGGVEKVKTGRPSKVGKK